MPATIDHYCFPQPEEGNVRLWRYMDFTKFVSLVSSTGLFFCRSDLFQDPFEGTYSKANISLRPEVYKDMPEDQRESMMNKMSSLSRGVREWTYISCWHANEYESAAMWDLYAKTNEAVAIETSYDKLRSVLPERVFLGCVRYIDYNTDWLPEGNSLYPFMHKRKSFEHEREVRALIQDIDATIDNLVAGKANNSTGQLVPIEVNDLISAIHVAPTSSSRLVDLVAEVASKYEISADVRRSDLYSEPVF